MKPYPLVALYHFTVPVATTLSTVHTTAQTSYGRALPPDTAQNTKTREPESDCSRDRDTTRRAFARRSRACCQASSEQSQTASRETSSIRVGSPALLVRLDADFKFSLIKANAAN